MRYQFKGFQGISPMSELLKSRSVTLSVPGEAEVGNAAGATDQGISRCPMRGMVPGGSPSTWCRRRAD